MLAVVSPALMPTLLRYEVMTSPNSSVNGTSTTVPARMSHQSLVSAAMPLLSGLRMSNGDPHDPAHGDLADAARRDRDRRAPHEFAERNDRTPRRRRPSA